jgi:hypothetical protein
MTEVYGWHFTRADRTLGYGDGRKFRKGKTLTVEGTPILCNRGLHASPKAIEALDYAPGPVACYVRLSGEIVGPNEEHRDKMAATERTVIAWVNAEPILREFIRDTLIYRQPYIVKMFNAAGLPEHAHAIEAVQMGSASFADIQAVFDAAWRAAWDAARDAAWGAARDAAWRAAWDAARDAAWGAARDAARDAARGDLNQMLETRLFAAMGIERMEPAELASA